MHEKSSFSLQIPDISQINAFYIKPLDLGYQCQGGVVTVVVGVGQQGIGVVVEGLRIVIVRCVAVITSRAKSFPRLPL